MIFAFCLTISDIMVGQCQASPVEGLVLLQMFGVPEGCDSWNVLARTELLLGQFQVSEAI